MDLTGHGIDEVRIIIVTIITATYAPTDATITLFSLITAMVAKWEYSDLKNLLFSVHFIDFPVQGGQSRMI